MVNCNQLFYGWQLVIPLRRYFLLFFDCYRITIFAMPLSSESRQVGDFPHDKKRLEAIISSYPKALWLCFSGFSSYREHSDMWLPAFIGFIEVAAYPILLILGQFVLVGGWIGIKTAGAWMGLGIPLTKDVKTAFKRSEMA
jgi:hypothetical protein